MLLRENLPSPTTKRGEWRVLKKNHEEVQEVQKPLALEVGVYYNPHVFRQDEYKAVGQAYVAGYTEVLGDQSSDERVYLVVPETLEGVVLDYLDEQTLEASLSDSHELVDLFEWLERQGKIEEVE